MLACLSKCVKLERRQRSLGLRQGQTEDHTKKCVVFAVLDAFEPFARLGDNSSREC